MMSHKQTSRHWPEAETPPPLDQKYTPSPASSWRGWSLWLRALGVVVPALGGFTILCLTISDVNFQGWGLFVAFLLGTVGALLFRSWGAILVVPLALT